jgi:hypothetical protein
MNLLPSSFALRMETAVTLGKVVTECHVIITQTTAMLIFNVQEYLLLGCNITLGY